MPIDSTLLARIQRHAVADDWVSFNRHFFLRSAGADQSVAAEIAGISLTYEIGRLFNIYARGLKRMRKEGHKTMVMNCDSKFNLFISHREFETIPEEGSYPFRSLAKVADRISGDEHYEFLLARVVSSFAELLIRKKADDFEKSVWFGAGTTPIVLPGNARIFVCPEGDPFSGFEAMKTPEQQLFHALAMNDHDVVFDLLDGGIDLNIKNPQGENLLFEALDYVHFDLALKLIERGIQFEPGKLAAALEKLPPRPEEQEIYDQLMAHT